MFLPPSYDVKTRDWFNALAVRRRVGNSTQTGSPITVFRCSRSDRSGSDLASFAGRHTRPQASIQDPGEIKWRYFAPGNDDLGNPMKGLDQLARNQIRTDMIKIITSESSIKT